MTDRSEIRSYKITECVSFRITHAEFGGLSNMAPGFPLLVNGIRIRTAEALYQACRFPHRPDIQKLIIKEPSPMTAKMRSKPYHSDTRRDWNNVRVDVMRWCLRIKLSQNWRPFSGLLLSTGNRPIVENSRKDDFWGAKPDGRGNLVGRNVLGRLLMELRMELTGPESDHLKGVLPLEIPQFYLLGKPIGKVGAEIPLGRQQGPIWQTEGEEATVAATTPSHLPDALTEKRDRLSSNVRPAVGKTIIPKECKRLAEVDFPIAEVSRHAVREKSIRHGHPSTLHLWWARRPLASCRAMLLALLLPDPCDQQCPAEFRGKAREILGTMFPVSEGDQGLRKALLKFIGDVANWDVANNQRWIGVARDLVRGAYPDETPLVVDPFAGGGSIPLEALRLGCDAFASDLNPVACLIEKAIIEEIPRSGPKLIEDLREAGREIQELAQDALGDFYPEDPDGAKPIAYLWARTVRCEAPNCGAELPLMRTFWLCKRANRMSALRYQVERASGIPQIKFEVFDPKSEREVRGGTISRARATCPCCGAVLQPDRVRSQLASQRGGADPLFDSQGSRIGGAVLLAVVCTMPGLGGRRYRLPTSADYLAIWNAHIRLKRLEEAWVTNGRQGESPVPDEPLPSRASHRAVGSQLPLYGFQTWGDLFSARQKLALATVRALARKQVAPSVGVVMSLCLDKLVDFNSSISRWAAPRETSAATFGRQALPMVWDYCETVPIRHSTGSIQGAVEYASSYIGQQTQILPNGQVEIADACSSPLPDQTCSVWFTDPPYYDAIPYSDLSDFFFVWQKRGLPGDRLSRDPFDLSNILTPKRQEAVQCEKTMDVYGKPKDKLYYQSTMAKAFKEGRRVLKDDGIASIVFANKTTEGWEALLAGLVQAGWTTTGSWPISTEREARPNAQDTASLATSVHLVCRPRPADAGIGDWGEVLADLPKRVVDWMERLQGEGVRGADLVFACIGPALEIFSRYRRVETAEGQEVTLASYLEKVWEVVGRAALEQVLGTAEARARNGAAGALEEDARLTALFLWTLQSTGTKPNGEEESSSQDDEDEEEEAEGEEGGRKTTKKGYSLIYDVVRRFAQPLGIELPKWEGRIIETSKGVVRLLTLADRAAQLFGDEARDMAGWLGGEAKNPQLELGLFPEHAESHAPRIQESRSRLSASEAKITRDHEPTTLDRVHAAMLLQKSGQANALRSLIRSEQERGPDFLRLANALSALYPKGSEEKRLLEAMLLTMPR